MSLFGPIGLLTLPAVWSVMVLVAYTAMFHALGVRGFERAFEMSGSSLFTLGFVRPPDLATNVLAFLEAATGLTVLGLLIAYLPTIYSSFSRREVQVAQLEVRAGNPPSGVHLLVQSQRMERFHLLDDFWVTWQLWFTELEETHTSLGVLSFFRSPQGHRSWVTASGAVLDGASLRLAAVDLPFDPEAGICVRAGFFALRAIADYYGIPYDPDPQPGDPISITKDEFLQACDELVEAGIPVRDDREAAWFDFTGWRVNYDVPLLALAGFIMTPYAPWSSDRSLRFRRAAMRRRPRGRCPTSSRSTSAGFVEDPGLRRGRGLVEADEPLGAEDHRERVGRQREEERVVGDLRRVRGHRRLLAVERAGDVDDGGDARLGRRRGRAPRGRAAPCRAGPGRRGARPGSGSAPCSSSPRRRAACPRARRRAGRRRAPGCGRDGRSRRARRRR